MAENQASTSHQAFITRAPLISTEAERPLTQHLIFLSHSGKQKPFVAKLDHALRNAGHNPFFDTHSLPLGEPFPPHILQNLRTCKLGVVVLSRSFLTSYWPMIELNIMSTPPSVCKILPLFFEIPPDDVKRLSPCFSEWQEAWHKMAELQPLRININEWEDATAQLSILNGIVYDPHFGEDFFIEAVVRRICTIIPPLSRYDITHLTGCKRLTQVVASLFEKFPITTRAKAPVIGFHAIGGQGKTTICKLMVNHYAYDCGGKCTLIEFPSNDCNETQIVEQCKRALRQLTSMAEGKISAIHSFDECMQHMKDRLGNHNVFIAIDNVWEISLEYAQRILDIGFTIGSKILVTSRSKKVLSNLLEDINVVMPLPGLNKEEAREVFSKPFKRNQASQETPVELNDSSVDGIIQPYQFKSGYHPVAIIALGVSLGRTGLESWPLVQKHKSPFLKDSDEKVNEVIRMNFDSIPKARRDLFMDVALIYVPHVRGRLSLSQDRDLFSFSGRRSRERGERQLCSEELFLTLWLSSLHGDKMNGAEIKKNLRQLEYDGLLEFDHEFTNVSVHDLYKKLGIREAFASGRYVLPMKDMPMQVEDINWSQVDRVVWSEDESLHNWSSDPVPTRMHLPKLQLLMINFKHLRVDNLLGSCRLDYMPALRVLDVSNGLLRWGNSINIWSWLIRRSRWESQNRHPSNMSWLRLMSDSNSKQRIHQWRSLCVLELSCKIDGSLCLNGLVNLQLFSLERALVEEVRGLDSLISLNTMSLCGVKLLHKVGVFSLQCTQLQVIEIIGCSELREIKGLCDVPYLRQLEVSGCPLVELHTVVSNAALPQTLHALVLECRMREQPNLSRMMTLEQVYLAFEEVPVAGVVGIQGLPCLVTLGLQGKVAKISSISHLPRLRSLKFIGCSVLRELDWASLIDLPSLEELEVILCHDLEKVVGEPHCTIRGLKYLDIAGCKNLKVVDGAHLFLDCETRYGAGNWPVGSGKRRYEKMFLVH